MNTDDKKLPDPQTGGRYKRLPDGELHQVHATKPADGRVRRETAANAPAGATAADVAPPTTHEE